MLLATVSITVLGVGLGLLLGVAARIFAVEDEDPLVREIENLMPGVQCGQCGYPGCAVAAAAIADKSAPVTCCTPGGSGLALKLAQLLGVPLAGDAVLSVPMVASIAEEQCTGCTRCFRACPTDAIVGANGQIHAVLRSLCTGCKKCQDACLEHCVSMQKDEVTVASWRWPKPRTDISVISPEDSVVLVPVIAVNGTNNIPILM